MAVGTSARATIAPSGSPEAIESTSFSAQTENSVMRADGNGVDIDVEDGFRSIRNRRNRYMIDRQVQKTRTFTGIQGTNTQDRAVQESMGRVVDRGYERLGTTDRAIITARRLLLQAVKQTQAGGDPPGVGARAGRLRARDGVGPRELRRLLARGFERETVLELVRVAAEE